MTDTRTPSGQTSHANIGAGGGDEASTLECDHCGDDAIRVNRDYFLDGEGHHCMSCGFPGHVVCDTETPATWQLSEDPQHRCADHSCEECREICLDAFEACVTALADAGADGVTIHECKAEDITP